MIRTRHEEPFESYWEFEEALEQLWDGAELEDGAPAPAAVPRGTPPYVEWVQRSLNRVLNLHLGVDGDEGPASRAAVRQFRKLQGLPDGTAVDAATEAALAAAAGEPAPTVPPILAVGIDANTDLASHVQCLAKEMWKGQHLTFVIRYYSNDGPPKDVSLMEAKLLSEAGIQIVSVWEASGGTMTYFSRARGAQHGRAAFGKARAAAQPSDRPIYFAIDNVDPTTAADRRQVEAYFEGVRDGMARAVREAGGAARAYPIGVYGSWNTLDWCRDQGIATWFWQSCSTATSHNKSSHLWPGANLRQVVCEHPLCTLRVDVDEAYADPGGWMQPVAPWADFPSLPRSTTVVGELEAPKAAAACKSPVGGNYGPPTPVCRGTPPYLEWVQASLNHIAGLKLAVDGSEGPQTRSALRSFQQQHQIQESGVGPSTEAALVAAGAGPVPLVPQVTAIGIDHDIELAAYIPCLKSMTRSGVPLRFVVRYYTYKAGQRLADKNLKPAEAIALAKAGIKCVAVWEFFSFANPQFLGSLGSYRAAGEDHGHTACLRAAECGQPAGTPIYFGIDEVDVDNAVIAKHLTDYFEGIKAGVERYAAGGAKYEIGVYSRWSVLDLVRDQGIVTWFWQSCSTGTSGGRSKYLWPGANMRQVLCDWPWKCASPAWPTYQKKGTLERVANYPDLNESYGNEGAWFTTLASGAAVDHEFEDQPGALGGAPPATDRGSTDYVAWLQHWLRESGVSVGVDGGMGPKTKAALRTFQQKHGLPVTGTADDATEQALIAVGHEPPPAPTTPLAVGADTNVPFATPALVDCASQATWRGEHLEFVGRYYSFAGNKKVLTPAEALALALRGLKIVAVWEVYGNSAEMTHDQGVTHAKQAFARAQSCGQPTGTPIYFAFDADPTAADKARILAYFTGVQEGLQQAAAGGASYSVGVYAPARVLDWCKDQGTATYFWQAYGPGMAENYRAWGGVHIRQVSAERAIGDGCPQVDFDEAYQTDHGAWWPTSLAWALVPPLLEAEEEIGHAGFRARRRARLGYEASESGAS